MYFFGNDYCYLRVKKLRQILKNLQFYSIKLQIRFNFKLNISFTFTCTKPPVRRRPSRISNSLSINEAYSRSTKEMSA